MVNIALRRSGTRAPAKIQVLPKRQMRHRIRDDKSDDGVDGDSDSDDDDDDQRELSTPSPKTESPSPLSSTFPPTLPPTTSLNIPPPPAATTIQPPPPPVVTTEPAATTAVQSLPLPPVQTKPEPVTTAPTPPITSVPTPTPTLSVKTPTPPPPPVTTSRSVPAIVKDPARDDNETSSELPSPTSPVTSLTSVPTTAVASPFTTLTPIAPPRTTISTSSTTTTQSERQSTTEFTRPTSTPGDTLTLSTTDFVFSSTSIVNGVPTTFLVTRPSAPATTLSTRTSSSTFTTGKEASTTGATVTPMESAAPVAFPSNGTAVPSEAIENSLSGQGRSVLSPGGVAALSIVIALASMATIAFTFYKCCWPRYRQSRPSSSALPAWMPGRRFMDRPSSAVRGNEPAPPGMVYVRPGERIMDQVMAAAYEAEQGNAGVYGRYAAERRGSWHTDNSSILEEKQRQYERAVAASAITGTLPPDGRKSKALQLGQMMNAFLNDRRNKPAAPEQEVEMPHSPPGTTSGPTAFMPKDHRVEWSWRVSVRRASQNLRSGEGGDGWFSKIARMGGSKS